MSSTIVGAVVLASLHGMQLVPIFELALRLK